jgi:hypothetical protein
MNGEAFAALLAVVWVGYRGLELEYLEHEEKMECMRELGVYLDARGCGVEPGWWDRTEKGEHRGWYLVWPKWFAEESGIKRRQYVRQDDLEGVQDRVARTREYEFVRQGRNRIGFAMARAGSDLQAVACRNGWELS